MSSSSSPSLEVLAAVFVEYLPAPQRHHESLRTTFTPAARPFLIATGMQDMRTALSATLLWC